MIMKSFRSSFYTVNSNSSFEAICRKPKRNVALNRKNDSTLNNPLKGSVDSVITNAKTGLRKMKIQFPEKLIISRSKSDSPSFMIENNVDILLNSETKLDDSFPSGQHKICGFSMPYRCDRDTISGELLLYIRDDIPTKLLKHDFGTNIEHLSVEINLRKRKWFFNDSYNSRKNKISNHLNYLKLVCSKYSKVYDKFIFVGDFNVPMIRLWKIFVLWTILKV